MLTPSEISSRIVEKPDGSLKEHARIETVDLVEIGEFIKDIRTLFLHNA